MTAKLWSCARIRSAESESWFDLRGLAFFGWAFCGGRCGGTTALMRPITSSRSRCARAGPRRACRPGDGGAGAPTP